MRFLILAFGVFLVGCASYTEPVVMRNAAGATVQCGPYENRGPLANATAQREIQCVEDYKQQGYVRR